MMAERLSPERRSANMRAIRSKNTKPEMAVRRMVYAMGYRYRLHRRDIPGKPDLAFIGIRKAIFVHGCFWHQHTGCREGRVPGSNTDYWQPKLAHNVTRDQAAIAQLSARGWRTLVVWECDLQDVPDLMAKLDHFLSVP